LKKIGLTLATLFTMGVTGSSVYNYVREKSNLENLLKSEANVSHYKDYLYRKWNAEHGGVYVPITEKQKANPYLKIKDRDVETKEGVKLIIELKN